jgi:hypothetical protein
LQHEHTALDATASGYVLRFAVPHEHTALDATASGYVLRFMF